MSKGHCISSYTHTQQQLDDYANQHNPNNHSNQCNPNNDAYHDSHNEENENK